MTAKSPQSQRRAIGLLLSAAALLAAIALLAPAGAHAAAPSGAPMAAFPVGKQGKGLRTRGVRVTAGGRAKIFNKYWAGLPISDVSVGAHRDATLVLGGSLKLKKGRRSVSIRGLLVKVKGRSVVITGKIGNGKRRTTIFSGHASPSPKLDGSLQLADIRVRKLVLTSSSARQIRRSIRAFPARRITLGRFTAKAFVTSPTDGGPTIDPNQAFKCNPTSGPSADPAKPVSAVDVTCMSFVWNVYSAWIGYVDQTVPVAPAQGLGAIAESAHPCKSGNQYNRVANYQYLLPGGSGWWDAASGGGSVSASGGFHSTGERPGDTHIDIEVYNVEARFNGANSVLWANVLDHSTGGSGTDVRVPFASFDATKPIAGGPVGPGSPPARFPVALTTQGATAFKYYSTGTSFGCIDVGFNY